MSVKISTSYSIIRCNSMIRVGNSSRGLWARNTTQRIQTYSCGEGRPCGIDGYNCCPGYYCNMTNQDAWQHLQRIRLKPIQLRRCWRKPIKDRKMSDNYWLRFRIKLILIWDRNSNCYLKIVCRKIETSFLVHSFIWIGLICLIRKCSRHLGVRYPSLSGHLGLTREGRTSGRLQV